MHAYKQYRKLDSKRTTDTNNIQDAGTYAKLEQFFFVNLQFESNGPFRKEHEMS